MLNFMHGFTTWEFAINTEVYKEDNIFNVIQFKMGYFFSTKIYYQQRKS